jgi:hypothetical protein
MEIIHVQGLPLAVGQEIPFFWWNIGLPSLQKPIDGISRELNETTLHW